MHSSTLLRDEAQHPVSYLSNVHDNSKAHLSRGQLSYQARHDALTGLINRDQLMEHIANALNRAPQIDGPMALLSCDLDDFKRINRTFGHEVGDQVLRSIADRVVSALRAGDVVARLEGDEFVVALSAVRDLAAARGVAQKIREAVSETLPVGQHAIDITVSIGVALAGPDTTASGLLHNSGTALHEAKNAGPDSIAVFNDGFIGTVRPVDRTGAPSRGLWGR